MPIITPTSATPPLSLPLCFSFHYFDADYFFIISLIFNIDMLSSFDNIFRSPFSFLLDTIIFIFHYFHFSHYFSLSFHIFSSCHYAIIDLLSFAITFFHLRPAFHYAALILISIRHYDYFRYDYAAFTLFSPAHFHFSSRFLHVDDIIFTPADAFSPFSRLLLFLHFDISLHFLFSFFQYWWCHIFRCWCRLVLPPPCHIDAALRASLLMFRYRWLFSEDLFSADKASTLDFRWYLRLLMMMLFADAYFLRFSHAADATLCRWCRDALLRLSCLRFHRCFFHWCRQIIFFVSLSFSRHWLCCLFIALLRRRCLLPRDATFAAAFAMLMPRLHDADFRCRQDAFDIFFIFRRHFFSRCWCHFSCALMHYFLPITPIFITLICLSPAFCHAIIIFITLIDTIFIFAHISLSSFRHYIATVSPPLMRWCCHFACFRRLAIIWFRWLITPFFSCWYLRRWCRYADYAFIDWCQLLFRFRYATLSLISAALRRAAASSSMPHISFSFAHADIDAMPPDIFNTRCFAVLFCQMLAPIRRWCWFRDSFRYADAFSLSSSFSLFCFCWYFAEATPLPVLMPFSPTPCCDDAFLRFRWLFSTFALFSRCCWYLRCRFRRHDIAAALCHIFSRFADSFSMLLPPLLRHADTLLLLDWFSRWYFSAPIIWVFAADAFALRCWRCHYWCSWLFHAALCFADTDTFFALAPCRADAYIVDGHIDYFLHYADAAATLSFWWLFSLRHFFAISLFFIADAIIFASLNIDAAPYFLSMPLSPIDAWCWCWCHHFLFFFFFFFACRCRHHYWCLLLLFSAYARCHAIFFSLFIRCFSFLPPSRLPPFSIIFAFDAFQRWYLCFIFFADAICFTIRYAAISPPLMTLSPPLSLRCFILMLLIFSTLLIIDAWCYFRWCAHYFAMLSLLMSLRRCHAFDAIVMIFDDYWLYAVITSLRW